MLQSLRVSWIKVTLARKRQSTKQSFEEKADAAKAKSQESP